LFVYKTIINGKELPYIFGDPSLIHPLGTNDFGNDTLIVLIHATKNSILLGFIVAAFCVCIAVFMGVVGSFKGGILDELFQLVTNIALVFPVIPSILLLSTMLNQRSMFIVATIIALVSWPWAARAIRAQVLTLKEREYVRLAKVTGMSDTKIAIMEIVPNIFSYVMLVFAIDVGIAITFEAAISMVGLGQETDLTLGRMLYWSKEFGHVTGGFYHLWLPPGIVLTLFIILIYMLHSSMTQVFNPRLREK
ncbi:MAG: ABC transporter permease, partial [Candidatus Hodarchaeota archaeon]